MLKFAMWPLVIMLVGLVIVALLARKGSLVSTLAKEPVTSAEVNCWLLALYACVVVICVATVYETDGLKQVAAVMVTVAVLLIGLCSLLVTTSVGLFKSVAPLAAEIGEQMTDVQKRAALRRTIRWFTTFRKW